jgi:hypothetical protein
MNKRTAKIIRDSKRWGEWAESVFAVRAAENGLPVSKPFGESGSFDCVVGRPGKFVAVQGEVHAGRDAERERIGLFGEEQQQEIPGRGLRFSGGVCNTAGCVVHRSGEVDLRASVDLFVHDGQRSEV